MISSTEVEARNVAAMVELRNVCTASTAFFSSCMMFSTHAVLAILLTACTV